MEKKINIPVMLAARRQRLWLILGVILGASLAAGLILYALRQNINFFYTPSDVISKKIPNTVSFRLGGLVKRHSLHYDQAHTALTFSVTDLKQEITVTYQGILPDLFQEGRGVIAEGKLTRNGIFIADQLLAKHDNQYNPLKIPQSKTASTLANNF